MSQEELKAFLAKAKGDTSLQSQLKNALDIETVEAIANDVGFGIYADDYSARLELSFRELESAAGGANTAQTNATDYQNCTCGQKCHYP